MGRGACWGLNENPRVEPPSVLLRPPAHPAVRHPLVLLCTSLSVQEEELDSGCELVFAVVDAGDAGGHGNIVPHGTQHWPAALQAAVRSADAGFRAGVRPHLADDGEGSTYFLYDEERNPVACFKPQDEEPFTPHNRKGWVGSFGQLSFRRGILSGEGCLREAAACMLDHGGLARVPATAMVTAWHDAFSNGDGDGKGGIAHHGSNGFRHKSGSHKAALKRKVGSFQEYVQFDSTSEDWSPSKFAVEVRKRVDVA